MKFRGRTAGMQDLGEKMNAGKGQRVKMRMRRQVKGWTRPLLTQHTLHPGFQSHSTI